MNKPPFVSITDDGMSFLAERPQTHDPGKNDYKKKPVRVAIHRDLGIELHGENFSVCTKLTVDDVLGIISMLTYVVREKLHNDSRPATQLVEVTK